MRARQVLVLILTVASAWQIAAARAKKTTPQSDPPPLERILAGQKVEPGPDLSQLLASKPIMPLGPRDVLKSYEIAMALLSDRTSGDFAVIVQAQQTNQITREQAEYLLEQRYEVAMMQYQVLSALHDVLQHDVEEAAQQSKFLLKTARSDEVLVVPLPNSPPASR
jgi:hypothetical protein